MAAIQLPSIPETGRELEDYVAGMFQAAGYFVEKNVRQRDITDILELDTVATSYDGPMPVSVLAEAKGGRWGFPDIFKVAGWMAYLGIERGGFFVKESSSSERDVHRMHRTVAPLGLSLIHLGDFRDPAGRFREGGFRPLSDPVLLDIWRFSFWVERNILDGIRQARRAQSAQQGPHKVVGYHDLINDHIFFIKDVAERLRCLYDAYRSHPRLSATLAAEIAGISLAGHATPSAAVSVMAEAMYEGMHPGIQGSFYVEHRARLAILKAAIDLACLAAAGQLRIQDACAALPATFSNGFRRLIARPSFRRYALLWQVFLWGFGGFYLADRQAEEFERLSAQTGIHPSEVDEGLRAFDDLFPLSGGSWIVPIKGTVLRVVKMVPLAFRGVGALQRLRARGARNYDSFGFDARTRRNMITWHNMLVRLLRTPVPSAKTSPRHPSASGATVRRPGDPFRSSARSVPA